MSSLKPFLLLILTMYRRVQMYRHVRKRQRHADAVSPLKSISVLVIPPYHHVSNLEFFCKRGDSVVLAKKVQDAIALRQKEVKP